MLAPSTTSTPSARLALGAGSQAVDLRIGVMPDRRATAIALGVDPASARRRGAYFLDTPELALCRRGVVARVCRARGVDGDSLVGVRPVVPDALPGDLRRSSAFTIEVDALPGGFVCSGVLRNALGPAAVDGVLDGGRPARTLFSKEQRAFFALHAGPGVYLDDLLVLGPIPVVELRARPEDFGRAICAELWTYPDGTRTLELSTRCRTGEAFYVAAELRAFLAGHRIEISAAGEAAWLTALERIATPVPA
jgi:hypothetical protein